jgi:hypothetical protein
MASSPAHRPDLWAAMIARHTARRYRYGACLSQHPQVQALPAAQIVVIKPKRVRKAVPKKTTPEGTVPRGRAKRSAPSAA